MSDPAPIKRMALRRPDQCAVCGREIAAGTVASWNRALRVVSCLDCSADGIPRMMEGHAGASAQREYDRRHARRKAHAREKLGGFGVFLARVTDEPVSTKVWKQGAAGEVRVATRLHKDLDGSGVRLLHDRRIPSRGAANIDHLAVGPGGVTVIDTKSHKGDVRVDRIGGLFSARRSVLLVKGRDQTKLIAGIRRQIADVEGALRQTGHEVVGVRGALCFINTEGLPFWRSLAIDDVLIDGPRAVGKLAARPGSLAASEIDALWETLARCFPIA